MTVARLNRGRSRFILGIVAIVVVIGFVAIFQNNQQENDELRQIGIRCEQQLGAMEAQKARMQNTIDTNKMMLDDTQKKLDEAKMNANEDTKAVESLRQTQKLTDSQLSDCQSENERLMSEVKRLSDDLKRVKEKFDFMQKEKEKAEASLRSKLKAALDSTGKNGEVVQLREDNDRLRKQIALYQDKLYSRQYASSPDPVRKATPSVAQSFNQQVPVSRDVFKLVFSNSSSTTSTNNQSNQPTNKQSGGGGDAGDGNAVAAAHSKPMTDNGILNSVENFQAIQKAIEDPNRQQNQQQQQRVQEENSVLAQPLNLMAGKASSSTSTTTTTESSRVGKNGSSSNNNRKDGKLAAPPILQSPTMKNSSPTTKKLPLGVAPYPESSLLENGAVIEEPAESNAKDDVKNDLLIGNEQENLAHEVPDAEFNIDNDKKGPSDIENNAQEDTNQYLNENRGMFGKNDQVGGANQKLSDDKQLKDEVQEDLGKEGDNYGDLRLDGQMEEDGDIGEYDDVKAMKVQGPAERN